MWLAMAFSAHCVLKAFAVGFSPAGRAAYRHMGEDDRVSIACCIGDRRQLQGVVNGVGQQNYLADSYSSHGALWRTIPGTRGATEARDAPLCSYTAVVVVVRDRQDEQCSRT